MWYLFWLFIATATNGSAITWDASWWWWIEPFAKRTYVTSRGRRSLQVVAHEVSKVRPIMNMCTHSCIWDKLYIDQGGHQFRLYWLSDVLGSFFSIFRTVYFWESRIFHSNYVCFWTDTLTLTKNPCHNQVHTFMIFTNLDKDHNQVLLEAFFLLVAML